MTVTVTRTPVVRLAVACSAMLALLGAAIAPQPTPAGAQPWPNPWTYRPPTTAPITDPFRAPPEPWLAGNRGIEYATVLGSPVHAIGRGRVAFAGQVAGRLIVSVVHPDGLRSAATGLEGIAVSIGEEVAAGQVIGLASAVLHLGVRRGTGYLDPALLWGQAVGGGRVHLVANDGGTGPSRARAGLKPTIPTPAPLLLRAFERWP